MHLDVFVEYSEILLLASKALPKMIASFTIVRANLTGQSFFNM